MDTLDNNTETGKTSQEVVYDMFHTLIETFGRR